MPERPDDFIASFLEDYFAEADEHLAALRRSLLMLEPAIGAEPPAALVEEMFRSCHSLKGISAMVELREAEHLAHQMEAALSSMRGSQAALSAEGFDALAAGTTTLEQVVAAHRARGPIPPIAESAAQLVRAVQSAAPGPPGAAGPATTAPAAPGPGDPRTRWRVTFVPSAGLVARGVRVDTIRTRLAEVGTIESVVPRVTSSGGVAFEFIVEAPDAAPLKAWRDDGVTFAPATAATPLAEEPAAPAPRPAQFVRVDLSRLDDLMRSIGDLVVTRTRIDDAVQRAERTLPAPEWRALQEHTDRFERQLRELRENVMRVRLVPVAEIFRRMPFVVRDLSRDDGKRVRLEMTGQATEIDKFLIERMMDPILHLVRNAVSHGIELPEERVAAGKPPDGTIRLAASTLGESAVLEVSDDGRGLDARAILERARDSGADWGDGEADPRQLLEVICSPGFSTRAEADRASGRGVGMAVVRETLRELGGTLSLETTPGQGTTFRAELPLTLAIADALIVHVGDRVYAVPQAAVAEVAEVDESAVRILEHNELTLHRGRSLPVVRLARLLSVNAPRRDRAHMIVIGRGGSAVGLIVDRIAGQREIVVKTLRDPLVRTTGVSGATELGDGRPVMILDVAELARTRGRRGGALRAAV